jgi:hypothetical protein
MDEHAEAAAEVRASCTVLFDHLDDPRRLGSHMEQGSWRTGGASMAYELDAAQGRSVGSQIRLAGRMLGLRLGLTQVVTERVPPRRKVWQTVGTPHLLVIGAYRMGFEIEPVLGGSRLRVFIDYERASSSWFVSLLGRFYARWCVSRMVRDAKLSFERGSDSVIAG